MSGMYQLSKCASTLNYYLNHTDIRPFFVDESDVEFLDGSGLLSREDTYFFVFDGGSLIFWNKGGKIFEGDIYFLPRKRGGAARDSALLSLHHMFAVVGAEMIQARSLRSNASARHFITGLGFRRIKTVDGVVMYEMGREQWEAR